MPTSDRKVDQNLGNTDALCAPVMVDAERHSDEKDIQVEKSNPEILEEPKHGLSTEDRGWSDHMDERLATFFTSDGLAALKALYLEGPQPPLVSDNGWAGRRAQIHAADKEPTPVEIAGGIHGAIENSSSSRGSRRGGGRDRGGRGREKRGSVVDNRKVTSNVCLKASLCYIHSSILIDLLVSSLLAPRSLEHSFTRRLGSSLVESWIVKLTRPIQMTIQSL